MQIAVQMVRAWRADPDAFGNILAYPSGWSGEMAAVEALYVLGMGYAILTIDRTDGIDVAIAGVRDAIEALQANNIEPTLRVVWTELEARAELAASSVAPSGADGAPGASLVAPSGADGAPGAGHPTAAGLPAPGGAAPAHVGDASGAPIPVVDEPVAAAEPVVVRDDDHAEPVAETSPASRRRRR